MDPVRCSRLARVSARKPLLRSPWVPRGGEKGRGTAGTKCDELSLCWVSSRRPAGLAARTTA